MAKKKKTAGKKAPAKAKSTPVKAKKASTKAKKTPTPVKKAPKETKKAPAKAKKSTAAPKKTTTGTKKTFSVVEFSEMTYLTLKGVNEWQKQKCLYLLRISSILISLSILCSRITWNIRITPMRKTGIYGFLTP